MKVRSVERAREVTRKERKQEVGAGLIKRMTRKKKSRNGVRLMGYRMRVHIRV